MLDGNCIVLKLRIVPRAWSLQIGSRRSTVANSNSVQTQAIIWLVYFLVIKVTIKVFLSEFSTILSFNNVSQFDYPRLIDNR